MKRVADNLTAASLSPDGHRLAVTARGEVFDVPARKKMGVTPDYTPHSGSQMNGKENGVRTVNK